MKDNHIGFAHDYFQTFKVPSNPSPSRSTNNDEAGSSASSSLSCVPAGRKYFKVAGDVSASSKPTSTSKLPSSSSSKPPSTSKYVSTPADDDQWKDGEMPELVEKKNVLHSLMECDQRIEMFEQHILNLHEGKVIYFFYIYFCMILTIIT